MSKDPVIELLSAIRSDIVQLAARLEEHSHRLGIIECSEVLLNRRHRRAGRSSTGANSRNAAAAAAQSTRD